MGLQIPTFKDQYGREFPGAYVRVMQLHIDREEKAASIVVGTFESAELAKRVESVRYPPLAVRTFSILPKKQPRHTETIDEEERVINPGTPSFDELFGPDVAGGLLAVVYSFLKTQPEYEGATDA